MVAVSGFDTEEDALEAVLGEMPMAIDCKGKNFFISGPMTGMHLYNAPNFTRVHADLKMRGAGRIFDPAYSWLGEVGAERSHEYYMQDCMFILLNNKWDYIVMLKGWENSAGSKLEHDVAEACGMRVIEEADLDDVGPF